jgi:ribosomal protein S18 acetylase RimI-like enzyme
VEAEKAHRAIELLDKNRHSRDNFSCEVESLQRYFRTQASQDVRKKAAAVFVLAERSNVLGYYTLSSYSIDTGELPPDLVRQLPSYPKLPAILIGRLARDQKYRGQGIGELLLVDALRRCFENTATVGAVAVVVEAENEKSLKVYLDYGFIQFPDHPSKLFILMSTVKETFSA